MMKSIAMTKGHLPPIRQFFVMRGTLTSTPDDVLGNPIREFEGKWKVVEMKLRDGLPASLARLHGGAGLDKRWGLVPLLPD